MEAKSHSALHIFKINIFHKCHSMCNVVCMCLYVCDNHKISRVQETLVYLSWEESSVLCDWLPHVFGKQQNYWLI